MDCELELENVHSRNVTEVLLVLVNKTTGHNLEVLSKEFVLEFEKKITVIITMRYQGLIIGIKK